MNQSAALVGPEAHRLLSSMRDLALRLEGEDRRVVETATASLWLLTILAQRIGSRP